jgi:hypothetical protein
VTGVAYRSTRDSASSRQRSVAKDVLTTSHSKRPLVYVNLMDLRVATNTPIAPETQQIVPGDHLRVWRGYFWHHGIYVGNDRVVQFGAGIWHKLHSCIEEVPLRDFRQRGRVEIVPKQQKWPGLWGMAQWELPPALPPEEIVRRARWLAARRFEGTYNLLGRNCESVALWCVCNMCESLQRQYFQSLNASAAAVIGPTYTYLNRRGRLPSWAAWAMLAYLAVRALLLRMYYVHNKRFYEDVRPYYAEYGMSGRG